MRKTIYLPAEWEQQSMVMLTWPHEDTDWAPILDDITETYVQMVQAICKYEKVVIATPHPIKVGAMLGGRLTKEDMTHVCITYCKSNDTWARDHGPITLKIKDNKDGDKIAPLAMLDFRFNGWGEKFEAEYDNKITRVLHDGGVFDMEETGTPRLIDNDDFVLEGGSIESDGKGTIFTTDFCLLSPNRNQPMDVEDIEEEFHFRLKARRIVWLHHGQLIGDDTDGHIDTTVRLAPDDVILYNKCYEEDDEQYEDFRMLEEELKTLRTIEGTPYTLLPLPQPDPLYDGEERLPATYANFLIINGAVIVPVYGQPEKDEMACKTIGHAFPGRDIIPIDSRTIVRQHGSIHCCTMQIPQ